jgi:hypothetical protein
MAERPRVSRRHRNALTRVLRATGLANVPEEAMLVELLRDLAKELDEGGGARTRIAYLSATKDLRRVLGGIGGRVQGSAEPKAQKAAIAAAEAEVVADDESPAQNDLAVFKEKHKIA